MRPGVRGSVEKPRLPFEPVARGRVITRLLSPRPRATHPASKLRAQAWIDGQLLPLIHRQTCGGKRAKSDKLTLRPKLAGRFARRRRGRKIGIMCPSPGAAYVNGLANVVVWRMALAACRRSTIAVAKRGVVNTNLHRKHMTVAYRPRTPSISTPQTGYARTQQHLLKCVFAVRLNSLNAT
jgi:hypothetical protein